MENILILNSKGKLLVKKLTNMFDLIDEFDCWDYFDSCEVEGELYNTATILKEIQDGKLTKEDIMDEFGYDDDEDRFNEDLLKYLKTK